jgi:hypothetical protein
MGRDEWRHIAIISDTLSTDSGLDGKQIDHRAGLAVPERAAWPGVDSGQRKSPGSGLFSTPSCPGSIVGAEAFHFRVRDGNGWFHLALATRSLIAL